MSRRPPSSMPRLVLLVALVCACIVNSPAPASAQTSSCGPRVRRAWNILATSEKQLYLNAVMAAMANGNHALFLEVHSDTASGNEGHRTCGMIYWHRRFLLAYENMLRSIPGFECVTIPYWDYYTDYTKRLALQCSSFESCSQILLDFGAGANSSGNTNTSNTNVFDGAAPTPFSGACVNGSQVTATQGLLTSFSLSNFCQSSSTTACWGCIPRDNWAAKAFPSGFGLAAIAKYISGSFGFAWFAQNIHYGVHNAIHNTAGSTMATLFTAADPIFYNHHSTIDLLHQWWYDCQVQRPMTETEKKTSSYAFQQCSLTPADVCPTSTSNITHYWPNYTANANGSVRIRAEDHPVLGQFFSPLPTQYWQYVSGTDLGAYSYTYEKDSLLTAFTQANISIGCPLTSKARRLTELSESFSSGVMGQSSSVTTSINLFTDLAGTSTAVVAALKPGLGKADRQSEVLDQLELMHCSWYAEREGGIDDYSRDYRTKMHIPPTAHMPCYNRMQQLQSGQKSIDVKEWHDIYEDHLERANGRVSTGTSRS